MEIIYQTRESIIRIYSRYRNLLIIAAKIILGVTMFSLINGMNFSSAEFSVITDSSLTFPIILMLGFLFAVLPITFSYTLITCYILIHFSAMLESAMLILIFAICVYVFYVRLAVKECIFILLILLGFKFHLEYAVVLIAGMCCSFTVIIPIAIGTFIWYMIPAFVSVDNATEISLSEIQSLNIMEIPENLSSVISTLQVNASLGQAWIYYSFVFAMIVIMVHIVSNLSIDYSKDIALLVGAILNIVSMIIIGVVASISVSLFSLIFFTVLSFLIAEAVRFFDMALDYRQTERLRFEDDENFYYVKVVPKIIVKRPINHRPVVRTAPEEEDYYSG